jgi:hypothetical protein
MIVHKSCLAVNTPGPRTSQVIPESTAALFITIQNDSAENDSLASAIQLSLSPEQLLKHRKMSGKQRCQALILRVQRPARAQPSTAVDVHFDSGRAGAGQESSL